MAEGDVGDEVVENSSRNVLQFNNLNEKYENLRRLSARGNSCEQCKTK